MVWKFLQGTIVLNNIFTGHLWQNGRLLLKRGRRSRRRRVGFDRWDLFGHWCRLYFEVEPFHGCELRSLKSHRHFWFRLRPHVIGFLRGFITPVLDFNKTILYHWGFALQSGRNSLALPAWTQWNVLVHNTSSRIDIWILHVAAAAVVTFIVSTGNAGIRTWVHHCLGLCTRLERLL